MEIVFEGILHTDRDFCKSLHKYCKNLGSHKGAVIISREIKSYASKCNYFTLLGSTMNNGY